MKLDGIPLMSMLKSRLGYLSQRQSVVAQNVANASTPGFTPKDLSGFSYSSKPSMSTYGVQQSQTNAGHMAPRSGEAQSSSAWRAQAAPDSETTLDGNQVVLEEQMIKMTEARMQYDAAVSFYQKSMNLLRMAARPPGR